MRHIPLPQAVFGLQGGNRVDGMGPAQGVGRDFRQADRADLPFGHQVGHGPHGLFDGHPGVTTVQVVQIDFIDAQPLQACFTGRPDIIGPAADIHRTVLVAHEAKLGGYDRIRTTGFEHTGHQHFIVPVAIYIRGIQKVDPPGPGRFPTWPAIPVRRPAIGMGHAPAPQTDGGYVKRTVAKLACMHHFSPE